MNMNSRESSENHPDDVPSETPCDSCSSRRHLDSLHRWAVFLSEGIQKFLFPEAQGVGRFSKIGIPAPEFLAPFVGVCEIACGVYFLLGLLTRFWNMAHEARTDWAMLLGSVFLLIVGAGPWSVDDRISRRDNS